MARELFTQHLEKEQDSEERGKNLTKGKNVLEQRVSGKTSHKSCNASVPKAPQYSWELNSPPLGSGDVYNNQWEGGSLPIRQCLEGCLASDLILLEFHVAAVDVNL